ncbi:dTDP-4-dehydrorhamnose 3,5-epimerase [Longimonas halophila]|uniref:dTDP-4-dehydrorhamnose 3,5-epimerase n=1 Tax=Longimonas halophila TaxID=1469170 RepID=A0A2H3P105_9BACT|nr:dTDP-4-dehydrorhamnose 3,5-epimerase [Longimonas halophila]PEN09260.1 dTDP-4-dehydrorhamnose 3,5-epimerase [Longimonas halophila]
MRFTETALTGAYLIDPEPHGDDRGFFARMLCVDELAAHGLGMDIVQVNISYSAEAGTLRGLHYQAPPHAEAKMIRCTRGAIFDVMVDLRPDSPTYRQWVGTECSAENRRLAYVPEGCAHGFLTLTSDTEVLYPVTARYTPRAERGLRYDDPALAIDWPAPIRVVSDKDRAWPLCPLTTPTNRL